MQVLRFLLARVEFIVREMNRGSLVFESPFVAYPRAYLYVVCGHTRTVARAVPRSSLRDISQQCGALLPV